MSTDRPTILDLDDPYFDGQTLPEALADYAHVHSTTGVCVKNANGPFCHSRDEERTTLLAAHQFAPKYPVVCSCGFSAGFAMDSETPWIHHVAFLLREAGLSDPDPEVILDIVRLQKGGRL